MGNYIPKKIIYMIILTYNQMVINLSVKGAPAVLMVQGEMS